MLHYCAQETVKLKQGQTMDCVSHCLLLPTLHYGEAQVTIPLVASPATATHGTNHAPLLCHHALFTGTVKHAQTVDCVSHCLSLPTLHYEGTRVTVPVLASAATAIHRTMLHYWVIMHCSREAVNQGK